MYDCPGGGPCGRERCATCAPVATSHKRSVSSLLTEANVAPSGLKAMPLTVSVWPSSTKSSAPVSVSHSRTVLSLLAEAIIPSSGLKITFWMYPLCPCSAKRWSPVT